MRVLLLKLSVVTLIALVLSASTVAAAGAPASISIVTGNNQNASVNTFVPNILCVQVRDSANANVGGATVTFTIATGGGSIVTPTETTDGTGIATLPNGNWKLGTLVGTNTLSVSCGAAPAITFSATGTPGNPATIAIQAGNSQSAAVSTNVAVAPSVLVTDAFGNTITDNTTVVFAVASGGGTVVGGSAKTVSGVATVGSWKLGAAPGTNTLTASCGAAPAATFSATSTAGGAASITIVAGDNQSATVNTSVSGVVCVEVKDQFGTDVAGGTAVTFAVTSGGGTLTGADAVVGAGGIATLGGWKLGTVAGANTLSVSSGSAPMVTFTATATPAVAAALSTVSGDMQTAPAGAPVATAVRVKAVDAFGNAVALNTAVVFAVASGGGSVTGANALTDSSGVATLGSWTLGAAVGGNTLSVTCGAAPAIVITATGVVSDPPSISSGPVSTPTPAIVNANVAFSVAASGTNLLYSWAFGDGSIGSGASVTHRYAAPGMYAATVTVSDGLHAPITATVMVTVNAAVALVGSGIDSDGDGFSDAFETVAGSLSNDATSTPTGQPITSATIQPLQISTATIHLNFAKSGMDTISLSGSLDVPAAFNPNNARVFVDVGGAAAAFTISAKGAGMATNATVKITIKTVKGVIAKQTSKFTIALKKGNFSSALAASGLINATLKNTPITPTFSVIFNDTVFQNARPMLYTAVAGKTGAAK